MAGERKLLRNSIKTLLLPRITERGFIQVPLPKEERGGEVARAFPFGLFHRRRGADLEILEIQLDKRGRAVFRINMGVVPPEGIQGVLGPVPQDQVGATMLGHAFQLYDRGLLWRKWFSVNTWFGRQATQNDYDELVRRVIGMLPEVDAVFSGGIVGPHVKEIDLRR